VGQVGVLDGEVVELELGLHLLEQGLVRLVEPDPDEGIVLLEGRADVLESHVGHAAATRIRGTRDDLARVAR
jgi:hypothetical protein